MTSKEVEEIKGHFDRVAEGLRADFDGLRGETRAEVSGLREEFARFRQDTREEFAEIRRHTGVVAEDLRSEIRAVGEGVALANERIDDVDRRVDALTSETRRGFAGVRAEIHRLHETDDELRRRIESQEPRGA